MKYLLLVFSLLVITANINAQNLKNKHVEAGKLYLSPLPVIGVNPSFGFIYGFAASANIYSGSIENTRMSTSIASLTYSTKNQLMSTFKSNIYLPDDKYILLGDWRYFDTSQPTYGLGTGPQSKKLTATGIEYKDGMFSKPIPNDQMMKFKYFRFHETILKKTSEYFYSGIGYHLDTHFDIDDNLLNLDTSNGNQPTLTSHYLYSINYGYNPEKYILSGVSFNFMFDSRDNAATPYDGHYALISYRYNFKILGSTQNSSSLWVEYRNYFALSKKPQPSHLLGVWVYGHFETSGHLPYMDLPALGWDQFGRSGRAYTQGRFRGENLIYNELEYRVRLFGVKNNPDLFGAVAFVNATTASNKNANIHLYKYMNFGYGIGIRFMFNKISRINVALDYAWGNYGAQGIFANVNETF